MIPCKKLLISVLLIFMCLSTQAQLHFSLPDSVEILCGTYHNPDSNGLFGSLAFTAWNQAALTTPFDDMVSLVDPSHGDKPVRPQNRYFIISDTLFVEMDKGYLTYQVRHRDTLVGLGPWNTDEYLVRESDSSGACPHYHRLSEAEKHWIQQSLSYFVAFYSRNYETAIPVLDHLCEKGYGPACMTLGLYSYQADPAKGTQLMEKACEIGYYGSYACYRWGELLAREGKTEAAKIVYQKACEGGHLVGCMQLHQLSLPKE